MTEIHMWEGASNCPPLSNLEMAPLCSTRQETTGSGSEPKQSQAHLQVQLSSSPPSPTAPDIMKRVRAPSHSSSLPTELSSPSSSPPSRNAAKYTALDSSLPSPPTAMRCPLPPHPPLLFPTAAAYEAHYLSSHTHRCSACLRNFPSARYLDLHIAETHDPIVAARRDAGEKVLACFVDGCDKVCRDWTRRRAHLVDRHGFPRNYDFFVVRDGTDGRRSLLRPGVDENGHRKSSRERGAREAMAGQAGGAEEEQVGSEGESVELSGEITRDTGRAGDAGKGGGETRVDSAVGDPASHPPDEGGGANSRSICSLGDPVEDITSSLSALKMVPRSVTFGRRKGKSGFATS